MHYLYKCSECNNSFEAEYIEQNGYYLCPKCGAIPQNAPLNGVLQVIYDFDFILKKYNQNRIKKDLSSNLESIPELFPLSYKNNLLININDEEKEKIFLTSLFYTINYKNNKLYLMDESRNPTFSYKDRASILVALKAKQLNKKAIICASTGNAGSSIAGISARLGIKSIIFVPEKIPTPKKLQIEMYGAELIKVKGDYDLAFDLSLIYTNKLKLYNRNTAYNPLTIEGKKTAAFDIYNRFKNIGLPDIIIIPAGDGVILGGIYKGFEDLLNLKLIDKLPQLVIAQPSNGSAIIDYLETGKFEYKNSETIADSLSAGAPRNLFNAAKAVKQSNGFGIRIDDLTTLKFQRILSSEYGVLVEPAAAITLAAYNEIIKNLEINNKKVLLLLTGNGLKDTKSFEKFENTKPALTKEEIDNYFGIN